MTATDLPPSSPLLVVRIITRLNVGGPARQMAGLSRALPGEGLAQVLVHGLPEASEGDRAADVAGTGTRIVVVPSLRRGLHPLGDLGALLSLVRLLRRERPDVVHTHLFKAGLLGRLAAILCRVPVRVHTFHGTVFRGHFGRLGSAVVLRLERWLARHTTMLVALTPGLARELVEEHRIAPCERITVIGPGIDLEGFRQARDHRPSIRQELGAAGEDAVVLILGRLSPVKDVSLALRVLSRVRREIPRLRGWIAGDGPCRRRLEKEARELDLEACVHFLGLRDDAHRLLGGADALLLTSKSEGVPIAVLEARAAGCPVIATRVGGLMDVLGEDPEGDGWLTLCPQGREDELSIALSRVLRRGPVSPSPVRPGPGEPMTCPVETLARAHRELYRRLVPRPDREPPKA